MIDEPEEDESDDNEKYFKPGAKMVCDDCNYHWRMETEVSETDDSEDLNLDELDRPDIASACPLCGSQNISPLG